MSMPDERGAAKTKTRARIASWSLSSRIVAGVMIVVFGSLVAFSLFLVSFTRFEVTERLDNSLQEVAERLEFVVKGLEHDEVGAHGGMTTVAHLPHVDQRTLAYQIATQDGRVELRSQNASETIFDVPLQTGFYDSSRFRVYVTPSASGRHIILVAEPEFHRHEAIQRAVSFAVLPMLGLIPLIWVLVGLIVRRSLRPLRQLQDEIRKRGGRNLVPVPPLDLPPELAAIHTAVNLLLGRLTMALEAERAFAGNAAHELRNPIAALLAQAQLLRARLAQNVNIDTAEAIVTQARRIGRTTEKLLQLSRATAGVALKGEAVFLAPLIHLLCSEMNHSDRIVFTNDQDIEMPVSGDMDAVGILLRNLIENALNHSPSGSIVRIFLDRDNRVVIQNECAAIDPAGLLRLREPFVRGISDAEGSGLGLAIVTGIANQLDARIEYASPIPGMNRGIEVRITLPGTKSRPALG